MPRIRSTARSSQARHRARDNKPVRIQPGAVSRPLVITAAVALVGVLGLAAVLLLPALGRGGPAACPELRVVAATSYAPVVEAARSAVATGAHCAQLDVAVADGRAAAAVVAGRRRRVDPRRRGVGRPPGLGPARRASTAGPGPVLATSPFYLLTDPATAKRNRRGRWLAGPGVAARP